MKLSLILACSMLPGFLWAQDEPRMRGSTVQNPPVVEKQSRDHASAKAKPGEVGANPGLSNPNPAGVYDVKGVSFSARLLNTAQEAKEKSLDVQVTVSGIQLVDPDTAHDQAKLGQGHLHYRLDFGPVISTTSTKLGFHDLPGGHHQILVDLVANDETPLGPHELLKMDIP